MLSAVCLDHADKSVSLVKLPDFVFFFLRIIFIGKNIGHTIRPKKIFVLYNGQFKIGSNTLWLYVHMANVVLNLKLI